MVHLPHSCPSARGLSVTFSVTALRPSKQNVAQGSAQKACFALALVYRDDRWVFSCRTRMVRPEGFEPPTLWFVAKCSIQLSYGRTLRGLQPFKDIGILFFYQAGVAMRPKAAPSTQTL